jgi:Peptidogalycan biosysnthesis/recognition
MARGLRVEWRESANEIPESIWDRCFPPPREGWLFKPLEQSGLEAQFTFAYALVLQGETVLAVAPTFTMLVPVSIVAPDFVDGLLRLGGRLLQHLRFQRTLFVGAPCAYEEGTVGTAPGVDLADVAAPLQDALWERAKANGITMVAWKDFPESAWPVLRALAKEAGLGEVVSYPGTMIRPIGKDFEDYLSRLSVKRRHNLRKKLRISKENTDLEVGIVSAPDDALVEEIWRLFQNTVSKATVEFEHLTRKFWEVITHPPQSYLIVLRERNTGKAVAFMLVALLGKRAFNKYIGIDYSLGEKSYLYFRLWEEFVRWATRMGGEEALSGQTSYRAKLDIGHELVPLNNYFRYRNPLIHWIATMVSKKISWSSLDENLKHHLESQVRRQELARGRTVEGRATVERAGRRS